MKSEFGDRETLGSQIAKTHDEHMKSDPIEVGDFIHKFGKQYMKDLFDYIEQGSKHWDRFYICIMARKTKVYRHRATELIPYICPKLFPMQENQEVWYVDCVKQEWGILWSLPERSEFDLIKANPCKDNEKTREWIKIFEEGTKNQKIAIP